MVELWTTTRGLFALLRGTAFVEFPGTSISGPSDYVRIIYGPGDDLSGYLSYDLKTWEALAEVLHMEKWREKKVREGLFFEELQREVEIKLKERGLIPNV